MIANGHFRYDSYATRKRSQRNLVGLSCVVLLHAILVYAVVNGLGRKVIEVMKAPLQTKIIEEAKQKDDLPPPPPPKLAPPPPPYIPPPEISIQAAVTESSNAIVAVTTAKAPPPPPPAPAAPKEPDHEVSARPLVAPPLQYPPRMLAEGREGAVAVECNVEPDGSTNNCSVTEIKGGSAFADAALNYVKAAKYSPRVLNGVAIREEHHRFNISFRLQ